MLEGRAKQRLDETTAALQRQERGLTRLAIASRANLVQQAFDVAVTAPFMNPATIALQQGPQILTAWSTAAIKFTPAMLAAGAAIGVVGAAATVAVGGFLAGEKAAKGFEAAVSGAGRVSGLTSSELRKLVFQAADLGDVSISSARDQATAYLSTGKIGRAVLVDLIAVGKDYAQMMGMDAEAATKSLADAMLAPDKAGRDLTRTMGLLDQEALKQIDSLMKSGDLLAAQRILLDAVSDAAAGQADKVGLITNAWDAVGTSISNAVTKLGEWMYLTEGERLQQIINQQASMERGQRESGRPFDARSEGLYRRNEREFRTIMAARQARAAAAAEATKNQQAQLSKDRYDAGAPDRRNAAAEARRLAADAARAAQEALAKKRREEDARAALALEMARARGDIDEVRRIEDANAARTRTRQLIDDGTDAEKARLQAVKEQGQIIAARQGAAEREAAVLTRTTLIEVERIKGNARTADEMAKHGELVQRINAYTQTGLGYYAAWLKAATDMKAVEEGRAEAMSRANAAADLERRARVAGLSGDWRSARELDREISINARAREIEARGRDGRPLNEGEGLAEAKRQIEEETRAALIGARRGWATGLALDIKNSGIKSAMSDQLSRAGDRLIENIIDGLSKVKWGDSGAGSWISKGLNMFFGKNAEGTNDWRGGLTWVGERGKELVHLPGGSQVFSHGQSMAMTRKGIGGTGVGPTVIQATYAPSYQVSGVDMERMEAMMAQDRAEFESRTIATVNDGIARRLIAS